MNLRINDFYSLERKCEEVLRSVLQMAGNTTLTEQDIMKAEKDTLSVMILSLVDVAENSLKVLRSAAKDMETLRSDQISSQERIMKLQEKLICKHEELKSVQFDSKSGPQQGEKVEAIVKSVVDESERQRQVVLFGVPEENCSDLGSTIDDVLKDACGPDKPRVKDFCRVGAPKPGKIRPVKVCFDSQEDVQTTIGRAKHLKNSKKYEKVFIAPDRSPAERARRRLLVQQLREKKEREPKMHHYISRGEVRSTELCPETETASNPRHDLHALHQTSPNSALNNELRAFQQRFWLRLNNIDTKYNIGNK